MNPRNVEVAWLIGLGCIAKADFQPALYYTLGKSWIGGEFPQWAKQLAVQFPGSTFF